MSRLPRLADAPGAILERPLLSAAILVGLVIAVFHDGFWGVPRSDQLVYLYEAAQFPNFGEVIARAPSWNRSVQIGDHILFRPLLYLFLTLQLGLFGYNFFLWQATGIALHAAHAVVLLRLFQRASPATPGLAFAAAGLFASLLISAEAVIWHHITAYVLFALCASSSLLFLLDHFDTGRRQSADISVLLAILATLTYELGAIYCVFVAAALLGSERRGVASPVGNGSCGPRPGGGTLPLKFVAIAAGYVALSLVDFFVQLSGLPRLEPGPWHRFGTGVGLAFKQIGFWLGGVAVPTLYDVTWGARTFFQGYRWAGHPAGVVNLVLAQVAVVGVVGWIWLRRRQLWPAPAVGGALGGMFLLAYSCLISFGRSLPRGFLNTFAINLHYAYVAVTIVAVTIAFALWRRGPARRDGVSSARPVVFVKRLILLGLIGLLAVNAWETMSLLSDYRRVYSARMLELLHHARRWHETRAPGDYFVVQDGCPGNHELTWFGPYIHHPVDRMYFLDALYPETSANLHQELLARGGGRIRNLSCADGPMTAAEILGQWRADDGRATVRVRDDRRVELIDARGIPSEVMVDGRRLFATAWRVGGMVAHDGRYVFWGDGRTWWR